MAELFELFESFHKNVFSCCGAGTAADLDHTTEFISANMELHRRNTNRAFIPVIAAVQFAKHFLFQRQGYVRAYLLFGGVDNQGPSIYQVYPHGSFDCLPFASMGSGGMAAMAVIEPRWKPDMSEEEGMSLVHDAIASGIYNDLGSGSNVDLCIIRKNSCKNIYAYKTSVKKGERKCDYTPARGTTGVLSTKVIDFDVVEEKVSGPIRMETE